MNQKYKLKGIAIRKEKNGMEIVETKMVENNALCKRCDRYMREPGSNSCKQCSLNHRAKLHALGIIRKHNQK